MTNQVVVVRDAIQADNFDPMGIDISEFQELSKDLPKDANLDLAIVEQLAVLYLRAADRCSEIHSTLLLYTQRIKLKRNTTRQKLYLLAKDEGHKTIDDKKAYAESHPEYIEICEKVAVGDAVKKWFEEKHSWFLKSHQYMKDKMKAEQRHLNASGFSETSGVNKDGLFGERKW